MRTAAAVIAALALSVGSAAAQVPRDAETAAVLDLRAALRTLDGEGVASVVGEDQDLLPQALEEELAARAGDAAFARELLALAAAPAGDPALRSYLAELRAATEAEGFAERAGRAVAREREADAAWEAGEFSAAVDGLAAAAEAFRAAGLRARASAVEIRRLTCLSSMNRSSEMLPICAALERELAGGPLRLARHEVLALFGLALRVDGRIEEGRPHLEVAWRYGRRRADSWIALKAVDELGWLLQTTGETEGALLCFEEFEAIARSRGDDDQVARSLRCQALVVDGHGRTEQARDLLAASLALSRERGLHYRSSQTLSHWADVEWRNGRPLAAATRLREAKEEFELARTQPGITSLDLAQLWPRIETANYDASVGGGGGDGGGDGGGPGAGGAEERGFSGIPLAPIDQTRVLRRTCGELLEQGRPLEALREARKLDELTARTRAGMKRADALRLVVRALVALERDDEVPPIVREILELAADEQRRICVAQPELRLRAGERISSLMSDVLRDARPALLREADEGGDGGDELELALACMTYGHAQLLDVWLQDADSGGAPAPDPQALRRRVDGMLGPRRLLLAFDFDAGLAVAARAGELRSYPLPPRDEALLHVEFARQALADLRDPVGYARHAGALGRAMLGPIADWLAETDEVLCIPDRTLLDWPLGLVLAPDAAGGERFGDLPFLFRTHVVVYVVGPLRDAETSRAADAAAGGRPFLAFVRARSDGMAPLPGARREATALADGLGAARVRLRLDDSASERSFKELDWSTVTGLHVACHVEDDPGDGLRSALLLAPGGGENGWLTVAEIARLSMPLAFASIAGCGGARGQDRGVPGRLSLGSALLAAGVAAVLVSSQDVDDVAAPLFFDAFYRRLGAGEAPRDALRGTRVELLERGTADDLRALANAFFLLQAGI